LNDFYLVSTVERIPIILTLLPGVHLSVKYLSTVRGKDLGISPVGISSGASYIFKIY
jgi:hypothetical protein